MSDPCAGALLRRLIRTTTLVEEFALEARADLVRLYGANRARNAVGPGFHVELAEFFGRWRAVARVVVWDLAYHQMPV